MRRPVVWLIGIVVLAVGAMAASWWLEEPERTIPGVLLSVGPAAKAEPYAVAQGAVTHGEAVLIDFGDGDFAFFVNHSADVLALFNGCGERAEPTTQERFPLLVDARFRTRNVPPYLIETRAVRYRFEAHGAQPTSACP